MKKITNLEDLRNLVLENIQKLTNNEIDIQNAAVSCKAVDTVISTIKTELDYYRMIGKTPVIPFIDENSSHKMIEGEILSDKKLLT